jgi:hypothetical protein
MKLPSLASRTFWDTAIPLTGPNSVIEALIRRQFVDLDR